MSYLIFEDRGFTPSGKTKYWNIKNTAGDFLGQIKWHAPWRKYVFADKEGTVFDASCLQEITNFLIKENAFHREK